MEKKLEKINLLVCDVDGVLTDGGMYYDMNGNEWKKFNTRDGKGIEVLRKTGCCVMFLTSEDTPIVQKRADKLQVDFCFMGIKDKRAKLEQFFETHLQYCFEKTAYIGDDINDLENLKSVAFSAVPADAVDENLAVADYICKRHGGKGCVREICELLLQVKV